MKKLIEFSNLVSQNECAVKSWGTLLNAAYEFCSVNYKIVTAIELGEPPSQSLKEERKQKESLYTGELAKFVSVCENLGIKVPEFEPSDLCRMAQ